LNAGQFRFRMTVPQRVFGILMLPVHVLLIPWLVALLARTLYVNYGVLMNTAYINLACYGVSFVLILVFMFSFLRDSFCDIFDDLPRFFASILIYVVAYYLLAYIVNALSLVIMPEDISNPNNDGVMDAVKEGRNVMLVTAVIFGTIVEECIFRGAIFGTLRTRSRAAAYIVSAALFALYHLWSYLLTDFSWPLVLTLIQYVPGGVVLARCYERSGTIWASVAVHAVVNVVAFSVAMNL